MMTIAANPIRIPITKPLTGEEEEQAAAAVIRSGWLTQGDQTFEFEKSVAAFVGAAHAVSANSATTALHICCVLAELGAGDEVLMPSYTHIATANSVRYTGATPVFVDIRPDTYNIDERLLEQALTPRTKAVMPVHQVGVPAAMAEIKDFAKTHGLVVIEDAACALGSRYRGTPIGGLGMLAVFSFHPRKLITTGEGGMIVTNDPGLAELARSLISHGESVLDVVRHSAVATVVEEFPRVGYNYRLSNLQGALGVVQMSRLDAIVARRRELGKRYNQHLAGLPGVVTPVDGGDFEVNYQSYMIRLTKDCPISRDAMMRALREQGIASRPGIMAIHHQPAYRDMVRHPLPETDSAAAECLILPLYPQMTEAEQDAVIEAIAELTGGPR